jgi:hypothetical protein
MFKHLMWYTYQSKGRFIPQPAQPTTKSGREGRKRKFAKNTKAKYFI